MWWMLLGGCAYRVALSSQPTPVQVMLPDGTTVVTPSEVVVRWRPYGHQRITASSTGMRPVTVDVREREVRLWRFVGTTLAHPDTLWGRPRGEVHLVLIPEHGPAGTWAEDDVP